MIKTISNIQIDSIIYEKSPNDNSSEIKNKLFISTSLDSSVPKSQTGKTRLRLVLSLNPEVVKIDVHAFEHKVLKGFESNLKKNVKILFLELHSNSLLLNTSKSNKLEIIKYLFELDFCCFVTPFDGDLKIYNTDNKFEIMNYHSNYKEINIENFSDLFFDKLEKDNLIICVKKNLTGILKNV